MSKTRIAIIGGGSDLGAAAAIVAAQMERSMTLPPALVSFPAPPEESAPDALVQAIAEYNRIFHADARLPMEPWMVATLAAAAEGHGQHKVAAQLRRAAGIRPKSGDFEANPEN